MHHCCSYNSLSLSLPHPAFNSPIRKFLADFPSLSFLYSGWPLSDVAILLIAQSFTILDSPSSGGNAWEDKGRARDWLLYNNMVVDGTHLQESLCFLR
jgi:hypothetical protein